MDPMDCVILRGQSPFAQPNEVVPLPRRKR